MRDSDTEFYVAFAFVAGVSATVLFQVFEGLVPWFRPGVIVACLTFCNARIAVGDSLRTPRAKGLDAGAFGFVISPLIALLVVPMSGPIDEFAYATSNEVMLATVLLSVVSAIGFAWFKKLVIADLAPE